MTMFPTKTVSGPKATIHVEPKRATPLGDTCFIESQFPVSKMSKESFAERRANQGQTITGPGKWWGRKPLVLCRATILGLLLPATDDPQMDREVYLRLMTMEDDGMLRRKSANIPAKELFRRLPPSERAEWFEKGSTEEAAKLKKGLEKEDKEELQRRVFLSLSYDERLEYCDRPEQIDGPSPVSWKIINAHLGTAASTIPELVAELGKRRFGHIPRLGDSFCGGGSIPFEAARIGCEAYGSDLNPVAALLTWSALNIVGGGTEAAQMVQESQRRVYEAVDRQVTEWGIEHREPDPDTGRRWRADAFLYCTEATCPECGWRVPMAPTWAVAPTSKAIVRLLPNPKTKSFDFEVINDANDAQFKEAVAAATVTSESELACPHCKNKTPIKVIRGDGRGDFGDSKSRLRGWDNRDVTPRPDDIFGERLYCIRWVDTWTEWVENAKGESVEKTFTERYFRAPTTADLKREARVANYASKGFTLLEGSWFPISPSLSLVGKSTVQVSDARVIDTMCDLWVTDPPYADAVNYDEISEFFLSWYAGGLSGLFPTWPTDSRRSLAVKGQDESFGTSMVQAYSRLAESIGKRRGLMCERLAAPGVRRGGLRGASGLPQRWEDFSRRRRGRGCVRPLTASGSLLRSGGMFRKFSPRFPTHWDRAVRPRKKLPRVRR